MNDTSRNTPPPVDRVPDHQAPFDQAAALEAVGNRIQILRDLAALFVQERAGMVRSIRNALASGDVSETERHVHSFRGAIGYLRARPLWEITAKMHEAALEADLACVEQFFPEFEQTVEALAVALQTLLDQPPSAERDGQV